MGVFKIVKILQCSTPPCLFFQENVPRLLLAEILNNLEDSQQQS